MLIMDNPAFFDQPPSQWNIVAYLDQHDSTSPSFNYETIIDKWIKILSSIASDVKSTAEQRGRAQLLLDQYKQPGRGSDRGRAREWLRRQQPSKKKLKTGRSVTIFQAPVNRYTFNNTANQAPINQGTFSDSTFNQAKRKRELPEDSEIPDDNTGVDGEVYDTDEEDLTTLFPPKGGKSDFTSIYNEFVATYKVMSTESKFVFTCSGRVLEDVIFENASALTAKDPVHLWVIDFDDAVVTSWFEPKELEELRGRTMPLPEADKAFLSSMARFSLADTVEEFRRVAEEVPYRGTGERYDRSKYFDAAWVNTVILSMLSILESPNNLLLYPSLREGWFDCNPWSFLIDQCMLGLDGVLVQRKEIVCLALKLIENICTEPPVKGSRNKRFDAVIHTLGDSPVIEYGAIEVAKSFESKRDKKWITDSTKLVWALHAMLSRLHSLVNHDEATIRRLQVVGLVSAGLNLQMIRMNGLNRNVSLLERGKIRSVPTTVTSLKSIFTIMLTIVKFKLMIQDCVAVIKGYSGLAGGNAKQTQQELFEELAKQNEL